MSRSIVSFALIAGLAVTASAPAAFAQGAGTPPAWDTLVRCAQTPDESERLACYDAAMHAAGFTPNAAAVTAEHHRTFGLSLPKVNMFKQKKREEGARVAGAAPAPIEESPNRIEATIDQIAVTQPAGKILIVTTDGQIWRQTDTTVLNSLPKEGDMITIRKEALGGFFCDVTKYQTVNCVRVK